MGRRYLYQPKNDKEKGSQVKQMGNIYKGVEEVLIWLGPSDDSIIALMESITWVNEKAISAKTIGSNEDWTSLCRRLTKERFWSPGLDTHSKQGQTLQQLLRRPWFNRVWILQEVANAKSAEVMCGSTACSSRTFAVMPSLMGLEVNEHTQAVLDIMPGLRTNTWWSSKRYLHFLLAKFAESQATLARDKIYALLGISEDANDPRRFDPCYQKDHLQVLRDTLCFLLFGQILDSSFSFPDVMIQELARPIPQLATRTLEWTLNQTEGLRDSARRTAILLVERINEGQLKRADLLSSLAEAHAQDNHELQSLLSDKDGDISLFLTFEENQATLKITSDKGTRTSASLTFPMKQSSENEALRRLGLVPAPFGESEDMTKTILKLKKIGSSKEELMRAYVWAGDKDGVQAQLENGADIDGADSSGLTAFHLASRRSSSDILKLLLEYGADGSKKDMKGYTALDTALALAGDIEKAS